MKEQKREQGNPLPLRSQHLSALTQTTMPPSFPPEIFDLVVHHLRDEPMTLKVCCLISRLWFYLTQRHLFACVEFHAQKSHIEQWKKTFPNPSTSPTHYTRSLSIGGIPFIPVSDSRAGGWIHTFHNLVHLHLEYHGWEDDQLSLVPFHGLLPTLKSLHLTSAFSEVLDLICSFPLLEGLALISLSPGSDSWSTPSTSPKLTGSLALRTFQGFQPVARQLLDLPDGLHFAKITVECYAKDAESTMGLVSRCSDTLESLSVYCETLGALPSASTNGQ
jgi:hypothetical protein